MYKENDIVYFLERQYYSYSIETFKEIVPYDDLLFSVIKMKVVNEKGVLKLRSLEKIYIPINRTKRNRYDGFPLERILSINSACRVLFNSRKEAKQYYYKEHTESKQHAMDTKEYRTVMYKIITDSSLSIEEKIEKLKKFNPAFEEKLAEFDDEKIKKTITMMMSIKTY